MGYPVPSTLSLPLALYDVTGRRFLEEGVLGGKSWGLHLGEDVHAEPGTPVTAVGDGEVVYAVLHPGTRRRGNWGHIVIVGHEHAGDGRPFFSLYGHLGLCQVTVGDRVAIGAALGPVGAGRTPENGFWPEPHLHFAIYRGPWEGKVLPGYFREEDGRTRLEYWESPSKFVQDYRGQQATGGARLGYPTESRNDSVETPALRIFEENR